MTHPALTPNRTAVITGGASGIGFATAERLVAMGLNVCIADHDEEKLGSAVDTAVRFGVSAFTRLRVSMQVKMKSRERRGFSNELSGQNFY